jgi:hypothetical protein
MEVGLPPEKKAGDQEFRAKVIRGQAGCESLVDAVMNLHGERGWGRMLCDPGLFQARNA